METTFERFVSAVSPFALRYRRVDGETGYEGKYMLHDFFKCSGNGFFVPQAKR